MIVLIESFQLVLMSMLEDEDELQEIAWAVGCREVVEDQVGQLVLLLMKKKLLSRILLLKMLWVEELLVEQHRWWAEVVDEIVVLEWTCSVGEVLIDLHVGLSNDFVVGDRWKMTDVKERPLDVPKKGLVELLFCRKTSDMSGLVDVVARNLWMISMLVGKSYEMLSCCMFAAKPDASDLLMFVADG